MKMNLYEEHHFKGTAIEEHYEKNIEDFTPKEWILLGICAMMVIAAIVSGIMSEFGLMVIFIGAAVSAVMVLTKVAFQLSNDANGIVLFFFMMGVATSAAGILMCIGNRTWLLVYLSIVILLGISVAAVFCLSVAKNKKEEMSKYTQTVKADCVNIDMSEIDTVNVTFQYVVDGTEYKSEACMPREDWRKLIHGAGSAASIYVNPENPADIMPVKKSTAMETAMGSIFAGVVVIGVVFLIVVFATGADFAGWF